MAKRDDRRKGQTKLDRAIKRNWIICAVTGAAIVVLMMMSK